MTAEGPSPNVQAVAGLYAAFARRDLPAVLAAFSPAVVVTQSEALPWGGAFSGLDGVRAFMGRLLQHITSQVEIAEYVEAGDRVVALGRTRGQVNGTGRPFDVRAVHVWTLTDGRIARLEAYIDTPAMLAALADRLPPA